MGLLLIVLLVVLFACAVAAHIWWYDPYRRMPAGARKLPGPWSTHHFSTVTLHVLTESTGIWFIGRVHDIPKERTWLGFYEWAKESGPIYKHELFGSTHVWISSEKIAKDLLSKQGSIFSDRLLINNFPINKKGGEYLPLLGENGTLDSFLLSGTG